MTMSSKIAALAVLVATLAVSLIGSPLAGIVFALTSVAPAALLVHLSLLRRDSGPVDGQWFPIGTVVASAAALAGCIVGAAFVAAAGEAQSLIKLKAGIADAVRAAVKAGFTGLPSGQPLSEVDLATLSDLMLNLMPGVSAALWLAAMLLCLWIAGHVALAGGQLRRPWPALSLMRFPVGLPLVLAASLAAAAFADGIPRLVALGFAGAFYAAYTLLGLAIVHHLTRRLSWRNPALTAVYVALLVLVTPVSMLLVLGALIDTFKPLRTPSAAPPVP